MQVGRIVVVPAAPALVPGLAADFPPAYESVLARCDQVLRTAVAGQPEVALVAAANPPRRDLNPVPPRLGRDDRRTGWLVAQHLLDRVAFRGVRRQLPATSCAPDSGSVLVVAADGSATVGPRSPRPDGAGAGFDTALEHALRTPALCELDRLTDTEAARVGCTTAAAWRALAACAEGAEWAAESVWTEAPFGVTTFVADLHRSR